jgi:uncharacterized membrane protein YgdD (TMEM256/DUF423 family)
MTRFLFISAALGGFLSVCLGAFAAHGLKSHLDSYALSIWQTGVQYQMYHSLALLAVALVYLHRPGKALKLAGLAFILGALLFSGSLYALALGAPGWLGAVTPLGGLGFLLGWLALGVAAKSVALRDR